MIMKLLHSITASLSVFSLLSHKALAAVDGGGSSGVDGGGNSSGGAGQTLVNPLKVDSLPALLNLILDAAIQLGIIVLTLAIIWVGFLFVAARGNEEKIRSARTAFMWTVIGGLILLGAKAIGEVIKSTAGTL